MKRTELLALKTDKERIEVLPAVDCYDWDVVVDWEHETDNPENKELYRTYRCSLYHRMELHEGSL